MYQPLVSYLSVFRQSWEHHCETCFRLFAVLLFLVPAFLFSPLFCLLAAYFLGTAVKQFQLELERLDFCLALRQQSERNAYLFRKYFARCFACEDQSDAPARCD
jgi:hypothetical protein